MTGKSMVMPFVLFRAILGPFTPLQGGSGVVQACFALGQYNIR